MDTDVEEIIESLVNMNHLIELDFDQLPDIGEDGPWDAGWLRFHDTLSGAMVCLNVESPSEDGPVGTIIVSSMSDLVIPADQVAKFLSIEQSKSDNLALANVEQPEINNVKDLIKAFENMDHILTIEKEDTPKGWVSLLDTTTSAVIYINEKNRDYDNEQPGTIVVGSFLNVTISEENKDKYLNTQLMKSELALSDEVKRKLESKTKMNSLFSGKL